MLGRKYDATPPRINIHTSISAVDRSLSILLQAAIVWLQSKHILVFLNDYTVGRGPRENVGGFVIEMKIHTQRQRSSLKNNKDNKKLKQIMSHIL